MAGLSKPYPTGTDSASNHHCESDTINVTVIIIPMVDGMDHWRESPVLSIDDATTAYSIVLKKGVTLPEVCHDIFTFYDFLIVHVDK